MKQFHRMTSSCYCVTFPPIMISVYVMWCRTVWWKFKNIKHKSFESYLGGSLISFFIHGSVYSDYYPSMHRFFSSVYKFSFHILPLHFFLKGLKLNLYLYAMLKLEEMKHFNEFKTTHFLESEIYWFVWGKIYFLFGFIWWNIFKWMYSHAKR